jgi:hypothetical protein
MLNAITTSRERVPERVPAIARWLATQRAIPASLTEATAWQLMEEARESGLELEGPKAPIIVQPRFSLWLVGHLGGPPLMHVFASESAASAKAQEIGAEMKLPVLVIDQGGDIVSRFDPPTPAAVMMRASAPLARPLTTPAVGEVKVAGGRAAEADREVTDKTGDEGLRSISLKVARHEDRWAVFLEGRLVATATTRERARQRARILKADPDFISDPRPVADD